MMYDFDPQAWAAVVALEELGANRAYHLEEAAKVTAELQQHVREARAAGVSKSEIARFSGVSRPTVDAWLKS